MSIPDTDDPHCVIRGVFYVEQRTPLVPPVVVSQLDIPIYCQLITWSLHNGLLTFITDETMVEIQLPPIGKQWLLFYRWGSLVAYVNNRPVPVVVTKRTARA